MGDGRRLIDLQSLSRSEPTGLFQAKRDGEMVLEPYIDAHCHVWTPEVAHYPLGQGFTVNDMRPPSFTAEELLALCRPSGVGRVNLIQMSFYVGRACRAKWTTKLRTRRLFCSTYPVQDAKIEDSPRRRYLR